jgi:hypothetical protein
MPTLTDTIQDLAAKFAEGVIRALRTVSLDELRAVANASAPSRPTPAKRGPGRPRVTASAEAPAKRERRSLDDLAATSGMIVKYVRSHPGSNSETIRKELGIAKPKWARPLAMALAEKKLTKKGEKRATKYWAA